ncbi:peptidoglycan-binding protein [Devosia nitrariae]|uniref:Peptidoglycan binding-like domain-containing protein n=1 Tax=Devosia nitrariae TaxID=2071872 RepID=A0ABQ5W048_9HYPH|nr:peptidoglycan-binding protein [Devosia nitrariae]GLQ53174.1 hypothetical protein GCM10010862_04320 [Devosia nitrariae]
MARAYSLPETADAETDAQSNEWQALRGELVALLDQVEGRYDTRRSAADPQIEGLARRVRALRSQVVETPGTERRREALRSVKRAVDRFSDRDDNGTGEPDELRAAIAEIRSRQTAAQAPIIGRREGGGGELAELTGLVSGLSGRLERLETELHTLHQDAGGVREIALQVEQLTQVIELVAGAVGETGQVKRLEAQLASLARLVADTPKVDLDAVNHRLDELATTVGKLAELQVQQIEREIVRDESPPVSDPALRTIEEGIRNVYDRIDTIEKNVGLSQGDLERVTSEMAALTAAIQDGQNAVPQALVAKIDAMAAQIGGFEDKNGDVADLRRDIAALRDAMTGALEPRFARIESQIEALNTSAVLSPGDAPTVGQIEAQLQNLMQRLDETGIKIDDLARLQSDAVPTGTPDMGALADLVAERTSAAVGKLVPSDRAGVDGGTLDALEKRMSALINTAGRETAERLTRLESVLAGRTQSAATAAPAAKPDPENLPAPPRKSASHDPARDLMPANPAEEVPLVDPGFAGLGPVGAALEAKNGPRQAAGASAEKSPKAAAPASRPEFDPTSVERPPRPVSSLAEARPDPFAAPNRSGEGVEPVAASAPLTSQSTFIAAARRAQRAKQETVGAPPGSNSLIGRALSRVMTPQDDKAQTGGAAGEIQPPAPGEAPPRKERRRWRSKVETQPAGENVDAEAAQDGSAGPEGDEQQGGFLKRNRRALLLAAALIAVSALALNLAMQRLGADRIPPAPQVGNEDAIESGKAPDIAPMLGAERLESAAELTAPHVGDVIDASATASINPRGASGFAKPRQQATPPVLEPDEPVTYAATEAATDAAVAEPASDILTGSIPSVPDGPLTFDPPAEGVGPEAMRQAAANGDARAQFEVAAILTEGRAVEQNYEEAAVWYERAAAQGFAPAQYRLGNLYESGNGVEKDLDIARLWYQRAAEAGNRMAMHNLAAIHASGGLGEQDFETAAEWFERAGERGMTDSQFNLGMLYARGLGIEQDFEKSYKWFALAAKSGDGDAAKARDDIARSLSAEAVSRLNEDVAGWKAAAIDLPTNFAPIGTWDENFNPGEAISNGEVVTKVQETLAKLGYDVGTADGLSGPKTREAIMAFERATGMSESGAVNPRLLAVLGSQPV